MLGIAICIALVSVMAQRTYMFNATALNVDGLPNKILGIEINPDGKEAAGATELCGVLANSGWDICGFSEDFNFHNELVAAPASNFYNFGSHGGKVSSTSNTTDGLGFACAKFLKMSGGTKVKWNDLYGGSGLLNVGDNGADGMIAKGFRMYTVEFAAGVAVDVYVLHMDANTADSDDDYDLNGRDKNIVAREAQLTQLATYIKNNHNNRPVIIIGDTNCRYTREAVKTGFIDVINADSRFTIKDAWVEHMWDGVYPKYGSNAMMTDSYGSQKGEVVDKIFYINTKESKLTLKSNSYSHDTNVKVSDHYPVVVNFILTDPNGVKESQELEGIDETVETWTDKSPTNPTSIVNNTEYYLRNEYSGLFFKGGQNWGAHIGEGHDGMPVTMTKVSSNTYKLSSSIPNCVVGTNLYTDNGDANAGNWIVEEIKSTSNKGNNKTKYIFKTGNTAIASSGNGFYADVIAYNKADAKQQWVLYTKSEMEKVIKGEMASALKGELYNASGLITLPVCCHENDSRQSSWIKTSHVSAGGRGGEQNASAVWEVYRDGSSHAFDFNQTLKNLPNGTYTLKVQAFFRDGDLWTSSTNVEPVLYAGSKSTKIKSILDGALPSRPSWTHGHNGSKGWIPNDMWQANQWFKAGHYTVELANIVVTDGSLKIGIKNASTKTNQAWCCFDNFQLYYHGTEEGDLRATPVYRSVKAAADKAIVTIESLNSAEATAAFDISAVAYRYNNKLVSNDGSIEIAMIDKAVRTAVAAQTSEGSDMTLLITNNSFEDGTTKGWTVQNANDTGVKPNTDGTYTTAGVDGSYLFNTWSGAGDECGLLYQDVTGLCNGYYRLNALVTAWKDRGVNIIANKQHKGVVINEGEGKFVDLAIDFIVTDGTARIGVVGDYAGEFNYKKGTFFKADNFRLTYLGSTGEGRVALALEDATAKAENLHEGAKAQFKNAVAQYEGIDVNGNGMTEETAIYNALNEAIVMQPRKETNMTWLITNPSFETADLTGWHTVRGWDTNVLHVTHQNGVHKTDEQYLFNTWNDMAEVSNSGVNAPVCQELTGLPNGKYRLAVDVTSDGGNKVAAYATIDGKTVYTDVSPENNATFKTAIIEFDVTNNTAIIGAVGLRGGEFNIEGGCWYKADNFRLFYINHELRLSQETGTDVNDWYTDVIVSRTLSAGTNGAYGNWNTFVLPFDMEIPTGWQVKKLTGSTVNGDVISMMFEDAETIKAGVPYMVRVLSNVTDIVSENVDVTTKQANVKTGHVEFVGVYKSGYVPQGAFFISSNLFYRAAKANNNKIKAFRAYIAPLDANNAKTLNYSFDDEGETTDIDDFENDVTIEAIYTLDGKMIDDLQPGVNILKMSNGRMVKVIIK